MTIFAKLRSKMGNLCNSPENTVNKDDTPEGRTLIKNPSKVTKL